MVDVESCAWTVWQIKNSEHTWGVSVQHFKNLQRQGWKNSQFRTLRSISPIYKELSDSWIDQMKWGIDWAMDALPAKSPLRLALDKEFAEMAPGQVHPGLPNSSWTKLTGPVGQAIQVGGFKLKYDERGAIVSLVKSTATEDETESTGTDWASVSNPLALLRYQSVTDATFGNQMRRSYLFRHPVSHLRLEFTLASHWGFPSLPARNCPRFDTKMLRMGQTDTPGNSSQISGANEYGKPGVDEDAHPVDQLVCPVLRAAYAHRESEAEHQAQYSQDGLLLDVIFPPALVDGCVTCVQTPQSKIGSYYGTSH